MKPTTEELIFNLTKHCNKGNFICKACFENKVRLQGRLDVFEEWLDYHKGQDRVLIREIAKIKEVLK